MLYACNTGIGLCGERDKAAKVCPWSVACKGAYTLFTSQREKERERESEREKERVR